MAEDNYWGNIARSYLGQGLAMGWGDELEAKFRSIVKEIINEEMARIEDASNNNGVTINEIISIIRNMNSEELTQLHESLKGNK